MLVSKSYNDETESTSRLAAIIANLDGGEGENGQPLVEGTRLIREGFLEKTKRDGIMKLYFILTDASLTTCKEDTRLASCRLRHNRTIPLHTLIVT